MNKTTQTVESAEAGGAFHIEDIYPLIDGGRFPVKRIVGERVEVWADIYRDGHDVIAAALVWRREADREWRREPMTHGSNDRWGGSFVPDQPGRYLYAIEAWTDEFATWRHGFELKQKAGADLTLDALEGAGMLTKAQAGGHAAAAIILRQCEAFLQTGENAALLDRRTEGRDGGEPVPARSDAIAAVSLCGGPAARAQRRLVRDGAAQPGPDSGPARHLQGLASPGCPMSRRWGSTCVYLTPIHPIGQTNRKGRNNAVTAAEDDPGSPYAIGSAEGGHDAVHPELGTLRGFPRFRRSLQGARHGGRARLRRAMLARPSLAQGASAMVQAAARRIDALRGESAQEI